MLMHDNQIKTNSDNQLVAEQRIIDIAVNLRFVPHMATHIGNQIYKYE